jgi:hypothetical protein
MKRIILLAAVCMVAFPMAALAGDYHAGATLPCYDCHNMHYSQTHDYTTDISPFPQLSLTGGPNDYLLRRPVNELCLGCHDNAPFAPDVMGANLVPTDLRQSGGLNWAAGHGTNDAGYEEGDGHSLHSLITPPGYSGGTYDPGPEGLTCTNCHAQHGIATQYRNLLNRGAFTGKTFNYATTINDETKGVFQRAARAYSPADVDFNEPSPTASQYGDWCKTCHVDFHGAGGSANMGGVSGGYSATFGADPWKRHPTADVNIGSKTSTGTNATHVSSLIQYNSHPATNRVKVMMKNSAWNNAVIVDADSPTPTCVSCHKAHGNKNSFGLIFMGGAGTVTEEGDNGATQLNGAKYISLCRNCHAQASGYAAGLP